MAKIDPLSPEATPGGSKKPSIKRINKFPLVIVFSIFSIFLIMISIVASQRAKKQEEDRAALSKNTNVDTIDTKKIADSLIAGYKAGDIIKPIKKAISNESKTDIPGNTNKPTDAMPEKSAEPELRVPIAHVPDNFDTPPLPDSQNRVISSGIERIQQKKVDMFQEAVTGKSTDIKFEDNRTKTALGENSAFKNNTDQQQTENNRRILALQNQDPNAAYQAKLAQLKSAMHNGGDLDSESGSTSSLMGDANSSNSQRNDVNQFNDKTGGDRWSLNSKIEAPKSRFELRAGFVMPATLISGINSDLPGQIIGQISQNVYDTATGKYLLIPQGTRLVGTYSSNVMYGQQRVMIAWQRLVFPDAKALDIGAMVGADQAGYSGFEDQVNNHYLRIFGSSLLMSFITAGVTYSQEKNQSATAYGAAPRANDVLSEALGQQIGQAAAQMIQKNMNIAPTLEIRAGYRFNVMVNKDVDFQTPYKSFDYNS